MKKNQAGEKVRGMKLGGKQKHASNGPLPVVSDRMHSFLLAVSCDNTVKCCQPGKLIKDSDLRVLLGASHADTLYLACIKIPDCQKEIKWST